MKIFLLMLFRLPVTKAHFHLSGFENKQDFRYCSESNPRELQQRPLYSERLTVWCAAAILQFGSLTSLRKRTKRFQLLLLVMCRYYITFYSRSSRILEKMQWYGFNKMEQPPILQKKSFAKTLSSAFNFFAW